MATKTNIYHDFEPFCEWNRGDDLLIVYVPEFKKEELWVQLKTSGSLKIGGERPLGDKSTMRSRFYKEIRVPEGCDIYEVHAKFGGGKLTITMPRKTQQEQRAYAQRKIDSEEQIRIGGFKFAKKKVLNVGIAVVAFATIGALVFFNPATSTSTSSSAAIVNKEE